MNCALCAEPIDAGDVDWPPRNHGSPMHNACAALKVIGHDFGVCHCTGFDTSSRASALELWRRLREKR